jgi:hypothetical protein
MSNGRMSKNGDRYNGRNMETTNTGEMLITGLQGFESNGNNRLTCSGQISEVYEKDCTGSQGPKWNVVLEKEEKKKKRKKKIKISQSFHRVHIQRLPFSRIHVRDEQKRKILHFPLDPIKYSLFQRL